MHFASVIHQSLSYLCSLQLKHYKIFIFNDKILEGSWFLCSCPSEKLRRHQFCSWCSLFRMGCWEGAGVHIMTVDQSVFISIWHKHHLLLNIIHLTSCQQQPNITTQNGMETFARQIKENTVQNVTTWIHTKPYQEVTL